MLRSRRSDRWGWRALGCVVALAGLLAQGGCEGVSLEMDTLVNSPPPVRYTEQDLSAAALEERMKEVDGFYAGEPRTVKRVELSYDESAKYVSAVNGYGALWRAARACVWLAFAPEEKLSKSERARYAKLGISWGREAITKASNRVESFYYQALSFAALLEITQKPNEDVMRTMRERMEMARSLDPKFDHCGPDRFLGVLMTETDLYPTWRVGDMKQALEHLKSAVDSCPDYVENHLEYARALKQAGRIQEARDAAGKAMGCPKPADVSRADHDDFVVEAQRFLEELGQEPNY